MQDGKGSGFWRRRRNYVLAGLAAFVLVLGVFWERCGLGGCPNVERLTAYQPGGATLLLDEDGVEFADLAPVDHAVIALSDLPEHVPAAFLAVEDKRFYQHNGIDVRRVGGALLADIKARSFVQGFSTITMQLARNVWPERLPGRSRSLRRKVLEVRVARDIEKKFAKDEILELYLNHIYFGGGAYGIEAASRNYFGKPAARLTLAEAALLASLPKSPTLYNPRRFATRARERRDLVLSLMAAQGLVPEAKAARARESRLSVRTEPPARRGNINTAPYFVEAARRILEDRFGESVYTAPLRVHTTLNRPLQRAAEQRLEQQLRAIENGVFGDFDGEPYRAREIPDEAPEYVQGAVVIIDATTGDVRALVGGRDFAQSRFDRATQARRQVGSAFKPFVYAAALAEGYSPSQLVSDSVLRLELAGGEVWEPQNWGGEFEGVVTVREALVRSKNVPTIRLAADVGIGDVTRFARRAGIRSELPDVPSVAIGSAGVTPLELTAAYSAFARLGTGVPPRFIRRVEDANGKVIWENEVRPREVMDSAVAFVVTDMLREAVRTGTGAAVRRAGFTGEAAGKTGTTNDGSDAWFVGYTNRHVATVWIGFDRPRTIAEDASGGQLAAPVWARLLGDAGDRGGNWQMPSNVIEGPVDPESGLVLRDGCRPKRGAARTELFIAGDEPASVCPAGTPTVVERTALRRVGDWFGRQWRSFSRWTTRHFGTEEPQRTPREGDYLGVPRLPRAQEVSVPQVEPAPRPLGTPVDTVRVPVLVDTASDSTRRPHPDSLVPDTLLIIIPDTQRDTIPD